MEHFKRWGISNNAVYKPKSIIITVTILNLYKKNLFLAQSGTFEKYNFESFRLFFLTLYIVQKWFCFIQTGFLIKWEKYFFLAGLLSILYCSRNRSRAIFIYPPQLLRTINPSLIVTQFSQPPPAAGIIAVFTSPGGRRTGGTFRGGSTSNFGGSSRKFRNIV